MRRIKRRKVRNINAIFPRILQFVLWFERQDKLYVINHIVVNAIVINELIELYIDEKTYAICNTVGRPYYMEYDSFEEFISAVKERGIIDLPEHLLPNNFTDLTVFVDKLKEMGLLKKEDYQ